MVSQETMANTTERTSSRKNVRRHSSLWRRSNCARRSETAVRPAAGDERWDASAAAFLISLMELVAAGKWADRYTLANYCKNGSHPPAIQAIRLSSLPIPANSAQKRKPAPPRDLRDAGNAFS